MKTVFTLLTTLVVAVAPAAAAGTKPLKVVATIHDLGDIARAVGGDRVEVKSLCTGMENIHQVRTQPSDIIAVSRADVFVEMGLAMEHAWVPGLLMAARNRRIATDQPGFVNVSLGWTPINVPPELSRRWSADVHPQGNPHFNLDPRGGRHIATRIHDALVRVDPDSAEHYDARLAAYLERLDAAEQRWAEIGAKLEGAKIVEYHTEFNYLCRVYGVTVVATIEPKPGVPPTPKHLAHVVDLMAEEGVDVILTATWSNNRFVDETARRSGARVVELPHMVKSVEGADTWIEMMDLVHARLEDALADDDGAQE